MKNIDVLKKKMTERINSLNADNFCSNINCFNCPFKGYRYDGACSCEDKLIKWLNEDAE